MFKEKLWEHIAHVPTVPPAIQYLDDIVSGLCVAHSTKLSYAVT